MIATGDGLRQRTDIVGKQDEETRPVEDFGRRHGCQVDESGTVRYTS
jgi:hypothetical protein